MIDSENTISQYLPLSVLPTELGGTAGPFADMCEQLYIKIKSYRDWFIGDEQYGCDENDATLLMHLRGCKFSLEKTKKKLELSYTIKSAFPNVFSNRDPLLPNLQCILKQNIVAVLPETSNDPLWVLFRLENATPETLSVSDFIKLSTMVTDVTLRECISSSIVGRAVLIDLKNLSPEFFTITYDAVGAENTITRYLPLSVLPSEFGGTGESFVDICEKLRTKIESYRDWFIEDEQYGCDESKRPANSIVDIDLFSIDGSFRKINVD
ncbi:hypothetical protein FQR65_LT04142 [Abscondita terminalis]|nr:hypothetical protein FQR65_LT04142 [Abscondita terminalis]